MNANLENQDDVKEYLQFLRKIRHEVDKWPDYKKVDGYVARHWTLKPLNDPNKIKNVDDDDPHPLSQVETNP